MEIRYQVIVVGAGPAGLNAAKYAANAGLQVGLIDASLRLGGQYWRHSDNEELNQSVHHDFDKGSLLMDAVRANARITIHSASPIWSASVINNEIILRTANGAFITDRLILATGAYDRSLPFPGWDIPGVMTAGAAQSLLKGQGVVAGKRIVVAGTGPFLLPVAAGLTSHGGNVVGVIEAAGKYNWVRGAPLFAKNLAKVIEGFDYLRTLRLGKVPMRYRQAVVAAHANGDGVLESVTIANIDRDFTIKSSYTLQCDVAAVSWGFTPDTSLAGALFVDQKVATDGSVVVAVDGDQRAKHPHSGVQIFAAGEITGIGGSDLSLIEGAIAGLAAAGATQKMKPLLKLRRRAQGFAAMLEKIYPVSLGWRSWLTPETTICRCEEVDFQSLQAAEEELGVGDARSAKLMTRCGMGLCQGRTCSRALFDLLGSDESDRVQGTFRPIISPISLGELAQDGLL
jgi:thioredoxin reductase